MKYSLSLDTFPFHEAWASLISYLYLGMHEWMYEELYLDNEVVKKNLLSIRGFNNVDVNSKDSQSIHHFNEPIGSSLEVNEINFVESNCGERSIFLSVWFQVLRHFEWSRPVRCIYKITHSIYTIINHNSRVKMKKKNKIITLAWLRD